MDRRENSRKLAKPFDAPKRVTRLPETMWIALDPAGQPIPATMGWTRDAAEVFVTAIAGKTWEELEGFGHQLVKVRLTEVVPNNASPQSLLG